MECNNELITIVGELPQLSAGEDISVTGVWANHPNFGRQFKVNLIERSMPASAGSILKYLSSGAIKGIGPATAHTLVKEFGDSTYAKYDDTAWADAYSKISAAKQYPVVASVDDVVVNGDHAEANVTSYMAFDPATKSTRSFDLQFRDDQWKICQSS